jgi:hypothetical protein
MVESIDAGPGEAGTLAAPMLPGARARRAAGHHRHQVRAASDFTSIAKLVEDWAGVQIRG